MTTYLGKSCSFGLPRVPFVNCCQFMYLVIPFWFWGQDVGSDCISSWSLLIFLLRLQCCTTTLPEYPQLDSNIALQLSLNMLNLTAKLRFSSSWICSTWQQYCATALPEYAQFHNNSGLQLFLNMLNLQQYCTTALLEYAQLDSNSGLQLFLNFSTWLQYCTTALPEYAQLDSNTGLQLFLNMLNLTAVLRYSSSWICLTVILRYSPSWICSTWLQYCTTALPEYAQLDCNIVLQLFLNMLDCDIALQPFPEYAQLDCNIVLQYFLNMLNLTAILRYGSI